MKNKKLFWILIILSVIAAGAVILIRSYARKQMAKIPELSFLDCLEYTLKGEKDAFISVGIIQNGNVNYTVYGEGGQVTEHTPHTYEIGSLTKTLTASLIARAVSEGKLSLDDTIDLYLSLPQKEHYPSIGELLTHTSGYAGYYFETEMIGNFFSGRNSFFGISKAKVLNRIGKKTVQDGNHEFLYSNFGYAVLGLILESVYETDYVSLMNEYLADLGMTRSHISDRTGDLENYWDWDTNDAYLLSGGVVSDIEDMLRYAEIFLEGSYGFDICTRPLVNIHASSASYEAMNIRMDAAGFGWMFDDENGIIWHNGGTGSYNSYLGISRDTGTAVVILSNLSPSKKIPATVLGIKLLTEIGKEE